MYIFIINPIAGNGRAKKIYQKLKKNASYQKLQVVSYYTQYKGHAEELTDKLQTIHEGLMIDAIIVIGGDGTMHEVLNGLKNKPIPVSFIPGGSGNDFARGCSIPKNPDEVIKNVIHNKHTMDYWLGVYDVNNRKKRFFVNCLGFGFDAVVARSANKSRFKKLFNQLHLGTVIYILTLIRELIFFRSIPLTIEMDNDCKHFDRCFLLTINNHPYLGGGMKINPKAVNHKDHLSILVVDSISKWKVLLLFGTVFTGKHLSFKEVETFHANKIVVSSDTPIPFQADGETGNTQYSIISKKTLPVQVRGSVVQTENKNNARFS